MAKNTGEKLLSAALTLFSQRWYETVSVAELCRHAGVSNGVFYRYFKNKELLVTHILDQFIAEFSARLARVQGPTVEERLLSFVREVYAVGMDMGRQVTIFREGQYRIAGYEDQLRAMYLDACTKVFGRELTEAEYLYAVGGLRFCSTRAMYDGIERSAELVTRLILTGVFPHDPVAELHVPEAFEAIEQPPPEGTRERFLRVAMDLIGSKGFHAIGVSDIAREAGLSVGAFYIYFESKEAFFAEVVRTIGSDTREYLSSKAKTHRTRLEQEAYGIWHFLSYFNRHKNYYAIVREAEFVARPQVGEYYDGFARGYEHNLPHSDPGEKTIAANFLMGLSHYAGIELLLNRRVQNLPDFMDRIAQLLGQGVS